MLRRDRALRRWVFPGALAIDSGGARLLVAMLLLLPVVAMAAEPPPSGPAVASTRAVVPDPGHGRTLYQQHCARCHSPHAWGDGPREIPALAGQRPGYTGVQLARFASGERVGSTMHGPAMREALQPPDVDRPQAIADLAAYLAAAPRNPNPEHTERAPVAQKAIYASACSTCHGADGAGSELVPAIGGQHYGYLLSRLHAFAAGEGGHPAVQQLLHATPSGQEALADYLSRLSYLTSEAAR